MPDEDFGDADGVEAAVAEAAVELDVEVEAALAGVVGVALAVDFDAAADVELATAAELEEGLFCTITCGLDICCPPTV